jgi:hypothetical protein
VPALQYYTNPSEDRSLVKDQHWSKLENAEPLALPLLPVPWQTTVNTFYQVGSRVLVSLSASVCAMFESPV